MQVVSSTTQRGLRSGLVAQVNDWLAAVLGQPAADLVGRTLREVFPGPPDGVEDRTRHVMDTGQPLLALILMSGYSADDMTRREAADADVMIPQKPFSSEQLLHAVRKAMD